MHSRSGNNMEIMIKDDADEVYRKTFSITFF